MYERDRPRTILYLRFVKEIESIFKPSNKFGGPPFFLILTRNRIIYQVTRELVTRETFGLEVIRFAKPLNAQPLRLSILSL